MSAPAVPPVLDAQLRGFAAHLRAPDLHPPPPGIEDRRLRIYRDVFRNNLDGLFSANFPVIRKTLGEAAWRGLVEAFLAGHRAQTPLFPEIAREFLHFLEARSDRGLDPPWLPELARYEWVELALQIAEGAVPAHDPAGDLLEGVPVASPFAWPLDYRWPVHRIGPAFRPQAGEEEDTWLLVRRDAAGAVRFSQLSPLVFRLLQLLEGNTAATGRLVLQRLAAEAQATDMDAFVRDGAAMLARMRDEGTLLGTRIDAT